MNLDLLLARCLRTGVQLGANNGELRVYYDGEIRDPELLPLLREHKQELLKHLGRPVTGASSIPVLPADARAVLPASPAQSRMWLLDGLEYAGGAYNMVGAYRLRGVFDARAMQAALDAVVARHEPLRTVFADVEGELRQFIEAPGNTPFESIDLSGFHADQQAKALRQLLERENNWRFDLTESPLLRAACAGLNEGVWVLLLNVHHIACDGWSIEILERDIGMFYAAFAAGESAALSPPTIQYADYVAWNNEHAGSAARRRQIDYWKATLDGMPSLHSLPLDKPRPAVQVYAGGTFRCTMPGAWLHAALAYCRAGEATLFMYLHAALSAVLGIYANESDIVVGFPVAGRRHKDLETTVGLFVDTLVLRTRLDGNPTFADMLAASRRAMIEALEHQDIPYDVLVDALRPERSRAYNPLVQIMLALQNRAGSGLRLAGLNVEAIDNPDAPVKFDLQVEAVQLEDGLVINWRFNRSLFDEASVARMAGSLERLLQAVVSQPELRLFSLPLAVAEERPPQPAGNPSPHVFPRLEERFEIHASQHPERIAVRLGEDALTYGELDRRASGVAAMLRARGIKRGSFVGLCTEPSPDTLAGLFGALKAGAAYVPLDPVHPLARRAAILENCAAEIVLTQRRLAAELAGIGRPLMMLDEPLDLPENDPAIGSRSANTSADPAYVIYTSGTTGTPKGVVVAHAGVVNMIDHFAALSPPTESWSGSLWGSLSFDVTIYEIFTILCSGGTLHIVPSELRMAPEALFDWLDEHDVASVFLHAGYLEPFIEHLAHGQAGRRLRRMMVGVEPIASDHLYAIAQKLPELRIINAYGPTETSVICVVFPFEPAKHVTGTRVPIGCAVRGMTLHVMNAAGEPAPHGAVGELCVGGVGLAVGYLNDPVLTEARFAIKQVEGVPQRVYRTGDLVRYRADGELEFIGRTDEQIKIRGFRVEPGEIEVRLCQQPTISDAVVVARGDGVNKRLVAYVAPKVEYAAQVLGSGAFAAHIKRELRHDLPGYMIPDDIVALEAIPLTVNGKVNRAALPPVAGCVRGERIAPRNETERRLVEIWKEILLIDEIGVNQDFFELGGQSLLAMRIIGRMRREFRLEKADLPFRALFENPTIETFAEFIATAREHERMREQERYLISLQGNVEEGVF